MSEEIEKAAAFESLIIGRPLIQDDGYFVMVSHRELDELIGMTMQMFELNGDVEQRKAMKQEFKWRARKWLDVLYHDAGYRNHELVPGARIVKASK